MRKRSWLLWIAGGIVAIALLTSAFAPRPAQVDVAAIHRGPLRETLEQEGKTRMHDRFIVSSPVAGKLRRIELHAGDRAAAGQRIASVDVTPLDVQAVRELEAAASAAQAAAGEAAANVRRAEEALRQASSDENRANALAREGVISREALEKAQTAAAVAQRELDAAKLRMRAAEFQLEQSRAALIAARPELRKGTSLIIRSPVDGHILRLIEQSERVIPAGAAIVEIGYSPRLEFVADFLSTDAVRIRPGMPALIENWGGEQALLGRVRTVEPSGFTKISALGVEEQRVNVIIDFVDPPGPLGDAFRADAKVITWEGSNVLLIPLNAVFSDHGEWNAFVVRGKRAVKTTVVLGHRSTTDAEVIGGVKEGDSVVVFPSNELADGERVQPR